MSALFVALFLTQTMADAFAARAGDAYVDCLLSKSAPPPLERRVAEEQARLAGRQCQALREALVEALIPLVPATLETREARQQEAERRARLVDSDVAHWLTLNPRHRRKPTEMNDNAQD